MPNWDKSEMKRAREESAQGGIVGEFVLARAYVRQSEGLGREIARHESAIPGTWCGFASDATVRVRFMRTRMCNRMRKERGMEGKVPGMVKIDEDRYVREMMGWWWWEQVDPGRMPRVSPVYSYDVEDSPRDLRGGVGARGTTDDGRLPMRMG